MESQILAIASDKVDLIVTALNEAQLKVKAVVKDAENPFFHSSYATLGRYIEAFIKFYSPLGLSFSQTLSPISDKNYLVTTLWHKSGQWLRSFYPLNPMKPDPQAMGAAVTYAKRYDLASITGMPTSDDDGEDAMKRTPDNTVLIQNKGVVAASVGGISTAQANRLWTIAKKSHWSEAQVKEYVKTLGLTTEMNLNQVQYSHFCGLMEKYPKIKE